LAANDRDPAYHANIAIACRVAVSPARHSEPMYRR
jgi:hypothetical protein